MPVPPPTAPSTTGPALAASRAAADVRRLHVLAVRVVQEVEGLGHHRIGEDELPALGELPLERGVADDADAVGAGEEDRAFEEPRLLDPVDPGHVAVAVLVEGGGHDEVPVALGPGQDRGDAGANRALAGNELALALHDGGVAHRHAGHVGDGVAGSGGVGEGNAEIAGARAAPTMRTGQVESRSTAKRARSSPTRPSRSSSEKARSSLPTISSRPRASTNA